MKFIMINSPSCVGKSTAVNNILAESAHFYKLSYDAQKWLFSKYNPSTHSEDVCKILGVLAGAVSEMGYDIICDGARYKNSREILFDIVKKNGYEIIEINLEADYEVLLKRFEERVITAVANPIKPISNTSVDRFKELFDTYQAERNPNVLTLRTDELSAEEITKSIFKLIA